MLNNIVTFTATEAIEGKLNEARKALHSAGCESEIVGIELNLGKELKVSRITQQ